MNQVQYANNIMMNNLSDKITGVMYNIAYTQQPAKR